MAMLRQPCNKEPGDVENYRVGVQLWRDIAIDGAGCIVFKLGGDKSARGPGRMIAADASLGVVFELVEGNTDALPVRFADTLIAADKRGERDRFGRGKVASQPARCSIVFMVLPYGLTVGILIFIRRSLPDKLLAGLWMLALAEFREVFGRDRPGKAELAERPAREPS